MKKEEVADLIEEHLNIIKGGKHGCTTYHFCGYKLRGEILSATSIERLYGISFPLQLRIETTHYIDSEKRTTIRKYWYLNLHDLFNLIQAFSRRKRPW